MSTRAFGNFSGAASEADERRIVNRDMQRLLGIIEGIVIDNHVSDAEIGALNNWLKNSAEFFHIWPFKSVAMKVFEIVKDGVVSEEERADLLLFLKGVVAREPTDSEQGVIGLPFDNGVTLDQLVGRCYGITGIFKIKKRREVHKLLEALGCSEGSAGQWVFLVVGQESTKSWAHSSFGRKIEEAIERRTKHNGAPLLVSEETLLDLIRMGSTDAF